MMNLSEYTTSIYDITLTTQSVDSTSSLEWGIVHTITYQYSESGTSTYWISSLQDSRTVSSRTTSSTNLTSSSTSYSSSAGTGIQTTATTITTSNVYRGNTIQQSSYEDTWSRSMVSLEFSHTGITSVVSVSSYGSYTSRTTTYSNKIRIDTTVTSTIHKTLANKESEVVSVSRTDSWPETLASYSTTDDIECIVSKGVASSLIYVESSSYLFLGKKSYHSYSASRTSLEATRLSGTLYNSTAERTWTSSSSSITTIPGNTLRYTSLWFTTFTDWNGGYFTYRSTSSKVLTVSTSSISYMSATLFPQAYTYSVSSETHSYIHEWISYTTESTAGPLYLGSQTLSIISQFSTTTFESESYSRSWLDSERSWSESSSNGHTVSYTTFVQNFSYSYNYTYKTDTWDWVGTDYVRTTTTARGEIRYETTGRDCFSVEWRFSSTYSASTYSSSTGSSSTWYSSTTYTGQFGVHSLTTTLSNYESVVSTTQSTRSQLELASTNDWESPEDRYTEFVGSGSTTYPQY